MRLPLALLLFGTAVAGCQCNLHDPGLTEIPDAGHDKPDAGPPPPKFPLKAGDSLFYADIGGRTDDTCAGHSTPGDCQLGMQAQYDITSVDLDPETNTFVVTANVTYSESSGNLIDDATIKPLVLEKVAPFASVTENQPEQDTGVQFTTNAAPTDQLTPLGFPFFQYNPETPDIFEAAGSEFCQRWTSLDADANCRAQAAAAKMEVFYKDDQAGGGAKLHQISVQPHKLGFWAGWTEELIPYTDGMARDDSSFAGIDTPPLAAQFFSPKLTRDGVDYTCDSFSQTCHSGNGADKKCLTLDPDAAPCNCNDPNCK